MAAKSAPVRVLMRITGDLPSVVAQGFKVLSEYGTVVGGTLDLADLDNIAALSNVVHIEAEKFRSLQLNVSVPEINANQVWAGTPGYTGAGVIVGIIDTGIDIFHHCFRKADGTTRIRWIWDQSLTPVGTEQSPTGIPGVTTPYGVEYTQDDIKAALLTPAKPFRHADLNGHGTHVAGTAAGNGLQGGGCQSANTYIGVAPDADLIVVKAIPPKALYAIIPSTAPFTVTVIQPGQWTFDNWVVFLPDDDSLKSVPANPGKGEYSVAAGVYTFNAQDAGKPLLIKYNSSSPPTVGTMSYLDTVKYIFQRANTAGPNGANMPAVVNLSLGGAGGPHDGSSNEEITLDYLLAGVAPPTKTPPGPAPTSGLQGRVVVCAAGNNGDHGQSGYAKHASHVSGSVVPNASVNFGVAILPNSTEEVFFELWYSGSGQLSFKLTNPANAATSVIPAGGSTGGSPATVGSDSVIVTSSVNMQQNGKSQIWFSIAPAAPTSATNTPAILPGTWAVTLTETAGSPVSRFDCWTDTNVDGESNGLAPGLSSTVTAPDQTGTVTIPATARNVIAVGAYNPANGTIYNLSGSGPTADGRLKPDICAPGVGIMAPKTEENDFGACCHCCLDYYVHEAGTSMAAPHVTGVVALMLQKNPTYDFSFIRSQIQAGHRPSTPATSLPNSDWGYGKVDALQSVKLLPAPSSTPPAPGPVAGGDEPAPETPVEPVGGAQDSRARRQDAEIVPIAANWWAYMPPRQRLAAAATLLRGDPTGLQVLALVSTHVDEVVRLVDVNRRITVAWRRLPGPELVWEALRVLDDPDRPLLPVRTSDGPLSEGLARLLTLLKRYGSPGLRADATKYRNLILALPGRPAARLSLSQQEGDSNEWSWNARARRA